MLNELGFALGTVGPIALASRKQAGLSTAGLQATLVGAHTNVKTKAAPACYNSTHVGLTGSWGGGQRMQALYHWGCTGADGTAVANDVYKDLDFWPESIEEGLRWAAEHAPPIDMPAVEAKVGQNTSWKLAQAVLPVLQAA